MIPRNPIHFVNLGGKLGRATCLQPFTFAGVAYRKGQAFPHERLGLRRDQLHGLWAAELVVFDAERAE